MLLVRSSTFPNFVIWMMTSSITMSTFSLTLITEMTTTSLTFEELDAILALIEFHDDWDEVSEIVGTDVSALYEKLSEMRDEV